MEGTVVELGASGRTALFVMWERGGGEGDRWAGEPAEGSFPTTAMLSNTLISGNIHLEVDD